MIERLHKLLRRTDRGSAIIEAALTLPILLLVVFGITEFGRALMTTNVLTQAAREGARVVAVTGVETDGVTRVNEVLAAANITADSVTVSAPDSTDVVTVRVFATFEILSAKVLPAQGTMSLGGTAVMRSEL